MTKDITVKGPGKALTVKKSGNALITRNSGKLAKLANAGLILVREHLSDEVVEDFHVAALCGDALNGQVDWLHLLCPLPHVQKMEEHYRPYIEQAKERYRARLPNANRVYEAAEFLRGLCDDDEPIDQRQASAMLHFLFSLAPGKRSDEERMLKLSTCTDIFSPSNNLLGEATGLWKPVPQNPILLALAIKQLQADQTFEPSEPELRTALRTASRKTKHLARDANEWLKRMRATDAVMFESDRDGWRAAHAAVSADVTGVFVGDDGSPYQEALNEVWEPKFYRENPVQLELERAEEAARQARLAAEPPKQIAACAKPAAKKTQSIKGGKS
jgi:hypothetical protein